MEEVFDIAKFDSYKEDNRREVKAAKDGLPGNLWETYSAMANTYGGVIICGVKERSDGSWFTTGMKNIQKLKRNFWNQINDDNKVSINLLREKDVEACEINGDAILVIHVPVADRADKPVFINKDMFRGSFKRNNEGDYHCTRAEVQAMVRDQLRKTIDGKIIEYVDVADLNQETIKSYKFLLESKRPEHVFLSLSNEDFLVNIGAARKCGKGEYLPTGAGLLMFGKEYEILYEYPQYFLDFREHLSPDVRWTDRIQSQSGDWSGNIFDFFTRVSAKLVLDLKKPFKLVNMVRVDETPIHDAVREAFVNCLVNSDFYESRGVVVEKYLDKIIIKNPGTVIVGKKQMLRGGESEPRNGNLMKMFNLIGYGERAGSGVPDIYATWEKAGYMEPTVEERFGNGQPNRTIVTLPLVEKEKSPVDFEKQPEKQPEKQLTKRKSDEIEERLEKVLEMLKVNPTTSRAMIAKQLGITEGQVRTAMNKLKDRGIIYRNGSDTRGEWIIKED